MAEVEYHLPPGMTEADLLRSVLRQVLDKADPPCCTDGPPGHTAQQHHDSSACHDITCTFDHPFGGPFPHPCD